MRRWLYRIAAVMSLFAAFSTFAHAEIILDAIFGALLLILSALFVVADELAGIGAATSYLNPKPKEIVNPLAKPPRFQ